MGWHMPLGGEINEVHPADGKMFQLAELQQLVGGYIEIVRKPDAPQYLLVVDEEGRLKNKEANFRASSAAGQLIVGDALLIHEDEID